MPSAWPEGQVPVDTAPAAWSIGAPYVPPTTVVSLPPLPRHAAGDLRFPGARALPPTATAPLPPALPEPKPLGPPVHSTLRESDAEFSACVAALKRFGTVFTTPAPLTDPDQRDCGIDRPVTVTQILPQVTLEGGATVRCDTARQLATWLRQFVLPAANLLPDKPKLTGMVLGSVYQCRATIGTETTNLSEHALGNAIDIAALRFGETTIPIQQRQDDGDMVEAFQRTVRSAACLYFTTVLGPGANAAHDQHLHLDIKARKTGYRLCQ
ncbi:extensin family protein [Paracoccus pacificus]|uniref:Extensin family protein n=1 Tax=Paracoccus pacificus TaxID=1463598 RepID=A0ABW4R8J8_9RHOB